MKLTKKQEADALKFYRNYWDVYLAGDIKSFSAALDDSVTIVGTAISEIFNNKKQTVRFYKDTVDQMTNAMELRNRKISVQPAGHTVIIHEQTDFYVLMDKKWTFYGHVRLSAVLIQTKKNWKLVHQHASFPDSRAEEGEQLASKKIAAENLKLREAVERRTVELKQKNRELEIETSLEKVRAIAMGMKEPADMLQVCKTISLQLNSLGIKETRNVQTAIFYEGKGTYMNYEYYAKHDKAIITETSYTNNEMHQEFASQMLKGKGEFFSRHIKGKKKVADWLAYQKTTNVFIDTFLETTKSLSYYWFSLGPVALGISTYVPLSEEETGLFKRFLKVFELSYRRYLDIEKAEAQAKEARIETALERVRAVAMAMKQSEELISVCEVMYKELTSLGFTNIRNAQIAINLKAYQSWLIFEYSDYGAINMKKVNVSDGNVSPMLQEISTEIAKSKDALFQKHITGKEFEEWRTWRMDTDGLVDPRVTTAHSMCFYLYAVESGVLGISTFNEISEDQLEIVKRFKNVFELSYTRFDDLQKAEAQAKEAKIEASLERVRAVAMSMMKPEELLSVSEVLVKEFRILGFETIRNAQIDIFNDSKRTYLNYECDADNLEKTITEVSYDSHTLVQSYLETIKSSKDAFFVHTIKEKDFENWKSFVKTTGYIKNVIPAQVTSLVYYNYSIGVGSLGISTYGSLDEDSIVTLQRFRNVFELAYRRYSDVAQAEAQAKEVQIELALERVRARTMAMQQSEELPDAANLLFQQMQALGMPAWSAGYCIWDDDKQGITLWMSSEGVMQPSFHMPLTVDPSLIHWKEAYERHESFHMEAVGGEELVTHYKYMRTLPGIGEVLDSIINAGHPLPTFQIFHCAYFSQGLLLFITYEAVPEAHDIFKRFGKVFDQTYTRFLDLQKAEAQVREAQIETALEKVRSRSLAMHNSLELNDVVTILFEKLKELQIPVTAAGIGIYSNGSKDMDCYVCGENREGLVVNTYRLPYFNNKICEDFYHSYEEQVEFFVGHYSKKEKNNFYEFVLQQTELKFLPDDVKSLIMESESYTISMFPVKHAVFDINDFEGKVLSEGQINILKRFAKVFEQAYTRFLDLQKAEAQAREAKIETALEKIRSRSLGMHHSVEIKDVVAILFEKLKELGLAFDGGAAIHLFAEGSKNAVIWVASPDLSEPSCVNLPYDDGAFVNNPIIEDVWKAKITGKHIYNKSYSFEEKNRYFEYVFKHNDLIAIPKASREFILQAESYTASFIAEKNSLVGANSWSRQLISDNDFEILKRIARVFEQAYIRFLDLQKAEAQAREAQIEAALERVRSRTMAMHKSDELLEVVKVLADQLTHLNFRFDNVSFGENNQDDDFKFWFIAAGQSQPLQIQVPYKDNPAPNRVKEAQKKGVKFFADVLSKEENRQWTQHLIDHSPVKFFPDKVKDYILNSVGYARSTSVLKNINLYIGNYKAIPYTEEENNLFQRFAQVFEQSYTRFLDLKKAEAQTREAQIEAALEKVRSRSLAMHKSEELREVVSVVFEKLQELDFLMDDKAAGILIFKEGTKDHIQWIADPGHSYPTYFNNPYTDHSLSKDLIDAKESGADYFAKLYSFEEKNDFFNYLFQHSDYRVLPEEIKNLILATKSYGFSVAFAKNSAILVPTNSGKLLSDTEKEIIKRFVKVFEQSYTRFLDLQKAEVQAREAMVEVALERVRSRTMAMHKGNELADTSILLFEQLINLGIKPRSCGFLIMDEHSGTMEDWSANLDGDGKATIVTGKLAYDQHPILAGVVATWQKAEPYFIGEIHGEELQQYYDQVTAKETSSDEIKEKVLAVSISEYTNSFYFQYGMMYVLTPVPLTDHEINVMLRFAGVFNLTYTRFLDLQNAETQAREAKIETALERTRTQSMIMQHSNELDDTLRVFHEQVLLLGIRSAFSFLWLPDEENDRHIFWAAWAENNSTTFSSKAINYPLDRNEPATKQCLIDWKGNEPVVSYHVLPAGVTGYFAAWQELIDGVEQLKPEHFSDGLYYVEAFMKYGCFGVIVRNTLSDDEKIILDRLATEFERTYRRFLDLQKAEAQAREAQIESALEKVRSRSLGMHKSEEILDVVKTVFARLSELNIELNTAFIIIFKEGSRDTEWWLINKDQGEYSSITVEYANLALLKEMFEMKAQHKEVFSATYYAEEKNELFRYLFTQTDFKYAPPERQKFIFESDAVSISMGITDKVAIQITRHNEKSFSGADNEIIRRFTKVFDQSYTRFLDLQKAEAQAKEAQVETSLERVRSKTMAMHSTNDVGETVANMFDEFVRLGIQTNRCGILIFSDEPAAEVWTTKSNPGAKANLIVGNLDMMVHPLLQGIYEGWRQKDSIYTYTMEGDDLRNYYQALNDLEFYPVKFDMNTLPSKEFQSTFYFPEGTVFVFTAAPITDEVSRVIKRFAAVFGQTYRRYLDLQKAEAQARESQIELSLERVRAKTMAMHNSQDVGDTVAVMFDEVVKLGIETIRCGIGIMHEPGEMEIWTAKPDENGKVDLIIGRMDMMMHPLLKGAFEGWRNKQEFYTYELTGDDLIDYFTVINNHPDYPVKYDITSLPSKIFHSEFHFPEGTLFVFSLEKLSAEASKIFKRFAGVFGQTYRRYLDLKKAEAQARSAQIEAAMEKVRARSLAMQKPEELIEVAEVLRKEMGSLGVEELETSSIYILDDASETVECWYAIKDIRGEDKKLVSDHMILNLHDTWVGREMLQFCASGEKQTSILMQGENRKEWINYCAAHSKVLQGYYGDEIPERTYHLVKFSNGYMGAASPGNISEESWNLLQRTTAGFSFAYTRFLDLQKAEAQAREATIEAALEKVRGKAMAMHTSNDLSATASMVFTELRKLGITPIRSGVGILNRESRKAQLYSATSSSSGDSLSLVGWIMLTNHPVAEKIYDSWLMGEDYYPELIGEQLKSYYENLLSGLSLPSIPDWKDGQKQYGTFLSFSVGCLYAWSENPYNSDEIKILKRFGSIIDLTFRRYIELQKSEANAKEAVRQASLDRIRAEIASMRTIAHLDRITPLIWNELTILGVPFIRCGVFIMDDYQSLIHTFLSTPDGKAIAAFHLPYDTPGNLGKVLSHWRNKKNYIDHWDESAFNELAGVLVKQGAIASPEQYLNTIPHGGFYLHFLPFLQGMLYVGNLTQLKEDDISLVQSVTDAFSTAYARYEDFNKLESAKQTVEKTLVDLRQAQTQLVQAEKMASLGQLTAGIAHEIQNPLNFVNNFSEVSEELIKEMLEEVEKGNIEDVKAIAGDLVQNLGKINHHGKRADSIVKGMLEHSRTSTGNMEPTDINALADEYLRLSYHGIRAKDKSFNTAIHTDFDTTINKINIIGQDIGRVLLNLYNNSFYAVNEKKKQLTTGYDPSVSVTTKKTDNTILISVKDNGNGIPQNIVDKIFQPFFTTKPTGSGTGLGLSLAYDIVKAHGGELKVETTEGEGSEFIIELPNT